MQADPLVAFQAVLARAQEDPAGVAAELRALAASLSARLIAAAEELERGAGGARSRGGSADRVRVQLVGPDGAVKQETDTGS